MARSWRRMGPWGGRQWPGTWAGGAAAMGIGAALGGLPSPLLAALGSASALLAAFSGWWTLTQRRAIRARGTVYVVREPSVFWQDDALKVHDFLRSLTLDFPAVRQVPGPSELLGWRWPLGDGAEMWDQRVDELVTAIRVVRRGDDSSTEKSLVAWVSWPVAAAMMARLLSAERGTRFAIRQRETFGRSLGAERVNAWQAALKFDQVPGAREMMAVQEGNPAQQRLGLTRTASKAPLALTPVAREVEHRGQITISRRSAAARHKVPLLQTITVLVIRLTDRSWGPLSTLRRVGPPGPTPAISLMAEDAEGIGITGTMECVIREWQCLPDDKLAHGAHRWSDFEALAQAVTDWIAGQSARGGGLMLLGAVMPQEIGLGFGIHIHRLSEAQWPRHLYPLVWDGGQSSFVIPHLDLGWTSLHTPRSACRPRPQGLSRARQP